MYMRSGDDTPGGGGPISSSVEVRGDEGYRSRRRGPLL